jgi:hypothetical protein
MSTSHCTFWVTSPMFDVRLRNSPVDSNGSSPLRSSANVDEEQTEDHASEDQQDPHEHEVVVGGQHAQDDQHETRS